MKTFGRYVAAITLAVFVLLVIGGAIYDTNKNGDSYRQMNNTPASHTGCDPTAEDCSDAKPYLVP
jgi:hypothetical protein